LLRTRIQARRNREANFVRFNFISMIREELSPAAPGLMPERAPEGEKKLLG
jgi:hypothetical protein